MKKKYLVLLFGALLTSLGGKAQSMMLTLDSCRNMALRNNNQLKSSQIHIEAEKNLKKLARTKYYPNLSASGGYTWMSRETSILSKEDKSQLNNLGTSIAGKISSVISPIIDQIDQAKVFPPELFNALQHRLNAGMADIAGAGNALGNTIVDKFRTDTRNVCAGAVLLNQPIYMGGSITAANKIADTKESIANHTYEFIERQTLYNIEENYWLVISLRNKLILAEQLNTLMSKLDKDVKTMIAEGVATRADGLQIAVSKNESDMLVQNVKDGLSLSKMLLCQRCGLPIETDITLADEDNSTLEYCIETVAENNNIESRPEIMLASDAVEITTQGIKMARSLHLPKIALTGGYLITNPNMYDGFRKRFGGVFTAGIIVNIPLTGWIEGTYRVRAAKAANAVAKYEQSEIEEKIELEIAQCRFKADEARNRLEMAEKNISSAEENLRCANLGFKEGVMGATEILAAQTAWYKAQSQKIDALIEVKMTKLALKKALGLMI